jgi:hypothetical protein
MNPQAIEHAKMRLAKAEAANVVLQNSESLVETRMAWSDFLLAASGVYSKLEQGAKGHPSSRGWFGRVKRERKDTPLLKYLHHARNSDEHGIEEVLTEGMSTYYDVGGGSSVGTFETDSVSITNIRVTANGKPVQLGSPVRQRLIVLACVTDERFGDKFESPTIIYQPREAAAEALVYLHKLIMSAESLVV